MPRQLTTLPSPRPPPESAPTTPHSTSPPPPSRSSARRLPRRPYPTTITFTVNRTRGGMRTRWGAISASHPLSPHIALAPRTPPPQPSASHLSPTPHPFSTRRPLVPSSSLAALVFASHPRHTRTPHGETTTCCCGGFLWLMLGPALSLRSPPPTGLPPLGLIVASRDHSTPSLGWWPLRATTRSRRAGAGALLLPTAERGRRPNRTRDMQERGTTSHK